jgi:IclR family pca regulon transcriptional regulator
LATPHTGAEPEVDRLQSVRRAFAVLETLAARPRGITPKELSHGLGLHLSTSYRLLNTLVAAGYAVRCADSGLFRLGPRVAYLHHGYLEALSPPEGSLPFVHALHLATGDTAMLNQMEGDDVVCTAVAPGNRSVVLSPLYVGMGAPAHIAAGGRVLLAWLPAAELETYLARRAAEPDSPYPLTNPAALRAELERIRHAGYALDRGEGHPEICCVAAPVIGRSGSITAAVCLMMSSARLKREEPALVAAVLTVAQAISALQTTSSRDERDGGDLPDQDEEPQAEVEDVLATMSELMSRVG